MLARLWTFLCRGSETLVERELRRQAEREIAVVEDQIKSTIAEYRRTSHTCFQRLAALKGYRKILKRKIATRQLAPAASPERRRTSGSR